jgi:hypothetical protein
MPDDLSRYAPSDMAVPDSRTLIAPTGPPGGWASTAARTTAASGAAQGAAFEPSGSWPS